MWATCLLHQQALAWGVNKKVKLVQMADNYVAVQVDHVSKSARAFRLIDTTTTNKATG